MKTPKKLPKISDFRAKTAPEKAVALKVVPGSFPSVKKASREDAERRKLRAMIIVPAVALSLLGLVMIYSASSYSALLSYGDRFFYVKKQLLGLIPGLLMMYFGYKFPKERLKKLSGWLLAASVILLAAVFIPGLGQTSYGATRWINLGFITFQPSELAKFALALFLAKRYASKPPRSAKDLIVPFAAVAAVLALIMAEPNMSVTLAIAASVLLITVAAGLDNKFIVVLTIFALAAVPALIIAEPYRVRRLLAFLDPWENPRDEGYQLIQSYYAIGGGGFFGRGLFNSRQKYLFLPFAESDFIFSVVAEELGVPGCLLVIALFIVFIYAGIKTAYLQTDAFRRLAAFGMTAVIAVQALMNIAVVTGSVPPTGLPLPFMSAGGSSLMVFLTAAGVIAGFQKREPSESHNRFGSS